MEPCEHDRAYFRDEDQVSWMYCPDCNNCISMVKPMNKLIALMREAGFPTAKDGETK